ncbi:hypothetical protein GCM10020220_091680 [Nonomuraea rubra]
MVVSQTFTGSFAAAAGRGAAPTRASAQASARRILDTAEVLSGLGGDALETNETTMKHRLALSSRA